MFLHMNLQGLYLHRITIMRSYKTEPISSIIPSSAVAISNTSPPKSDDWGLILIIRDVIGAFYSLLRITYKDYVVFLHIVTLIVLSVF